nr:translation initiation factor IF-2-like [Gorilla gorilla gorilla]
MPTHPHVPAPTGRAERKPALLLGPLRSQTHAEGHNRSASPSHVEGPQPARGSAVGGLGRRPWQGCCGVGPRGLGLRAGAPPPPPRPVPAASRLSLPPQLPRPPRGSGVPEPTGLRLGPDWSARRGFPTAGGTQWEAVRPRSACRPSLPLCRRRAISLEERLGTSSSQRRGSRREMFTSIHHGHPVLGAGFIRNQMGLVPAPIELTVWRRGWATRQSQRGDSVGTLHVTR